MNASSGRTRRGPSLPVRGKRPRPPAASAGPPSASAPLAGVAACLSGQPSGRKLRLESLVSRLGGASVRDFDPAFVTHLILDEGRGDKFEYVERSRERLLAARRGRGGEGGEWVERLRVVTSEWVEDCWRERRRVDEAGYAVRSAAEGEGAEGGLPEEIRGAALEECCDRMLRQKFGRVFASQSFLLVGFDSAGGGERDEALLRVKQLISKLIRRGGGAIYWHPNDVISVVVLSDSCSEELGGSVVVLNFLEFYLLISLRECRTNRPMT